MPRQYKKTLVNGRRLLRALSTNCEATNRQLSVIVGVSEATISRLFDRIRSDPQPFGFDAAYLIFRQDQFDKRIVVNFAGTIFPRAPFGSHWSTIQICVSRVDKAVENRCRNIAVFLELILRGDQLTRVQRHWTVTRMEDYSEMANSLRRTAENADALYEATRIRRRD
jgi:DNA-binding Lrp family transcriptional regulator